MAGVVAVDSDDEWASIARDLSISRDDLVQVASAFTTPQTASIDVESCPTAPSILAPRTTYTNSLAPLRSSNPVLRQLANKTSSKRVSALAPSWYPPGIIQNKSTASNIDDVGTSDENNSSAYNVDITRSSILPKPQKEVVQQNTPVKEVQQNKTVEYSEFVKLNDYKTIEDVILIAYEHKSLSPKHMSAVWTSLSRLIVTTTHAKMKYRGQPRNHNELQSNLKVLLTRTLDGLDNYGPIHLSQLALSIAKIIKTVTTNGGMNIWDHKLFREVLVVSHCPNNFKKEIVFQSIASAVVPLLSQFDAQGYANVAYACAIAGCLPRVNGQSLFDHITDAVASIEDMTNFTPQNLTNLMWAFASAKNYSKRLCEYI